MYFGEDTSTYHEKALTSPQSSFPNPSGSQQQPHASHNLTLPLGHRPAKVLKILVHFSGPWLAISEVFFQSGEWDNLLFVSLEVEA